MTNWDFGQEDFSKKKNNLYVISIGMSFLSADAS